MKAFPAYLLFVTMSSVIFASDTPVVFWASDSVQPGDAVLLYGDGLALTDSLRVQRMPDDHSTNGAAAPLLDVQTLQPCNGSLKFLFPSGTQPGVYSVELKGAKPLLINRPQIWFVQPEHLEPGLVQNQASPGSKIQIVGKDFLLPGKKGYPLLVIRSLSGGVERFLALDNAEKFSLRSTLASDLAPGRYQIRVSNGFGGQAAFSDPLTIDIRKPDVWPDNIFNVRSFGALGDDSTDDTMAIRSALDAAEKNGGGVVYFPWGTYRLTDWIRIPRRTILRGDERDATLLKWPVDEPQSEADFVPACIYGDTSYGIENLSLVARKANTILMDLSSPNNIAPELKPFVNPEGSRDVFLRHVAFHHWMLCSHPDRNQVLWAKRYTDNSNPFNFHDLAIRNFEVSDCLFQGANQAFFNIRNARILRNSFSNEMGYCWTCLGGGAWYTVAEENDLRCSSSWGYGKIGLKWILSSRNISHNFVHGEREAMTLDISATPAIPYVETPEGIHFTGNQNIAWFGNARAVSSNSLTIDAIKAAPGEFVGKTVLILDGKGTGQYRQIITNSQSEFSLDHPWDVTPTTESTLGIWDLCRHMIVSECEGYDTSAFAQLYGSFYDYVVDGCHVDRSQGTWGQSGWFVQFRENVMRYAFSYHQHIGNPGKNREGNAPYAFNGLTDGNLRITKFGSAQYGVPGGKSLLVRDVVSHPVPGVRGCIIKHNDLEYNQRAVFLPGRDPMARQGTNDFVHMTDCLIPNSEVEVRERG